MNNITDKSEYPEIPSPLGHHIVVHSRSCFFDFSLDFPLDLPLKSRTFALPLPAFSLPS